MVQFFRSHQVLKIIIFRQIRHNTKKKVPIGIVIGTEIGRESGSETEIGTVGTESENANEKENVNVRGNENERENVNGRKSEKEKKNENES